VRGAGHEQKRPEKPARAKQKKNNTYSRVGATGHGREADRKLKIIYFCPEPRSLSPGPNSERDPGRLHARKKCCQKLAETAVQKKRCAEGKKANN